MIGFAVAIFTASVLGSLHCVGMCGPIAIWLVGSDRRPTDVLAYHFGRLTTYLSAGLVGGIFGQTVSAGGNHFGWQSLAAQAAGALLVIVGITQILKRLGWLKVPPRISPLSSVSQTLTRWIHSAKPVLDSQDPQAKAFLGGLITTWLPCGWLYLFVLVAAGTGQVTTAMLVMFAFWLGSLPALCGLVFGVRKLALKFHRLIPTAMSVVLIMTGLYTATGRAHADLSTLSADSTIMQTGQDLNANAVTDVADKSLPCCCDGPSTCGGSKP